MEKFYKTQNFVVSLKLFTATQIIQYNQITIQWLSTWGDLLFKVSKTDKYWTNRLNYWWRWNEDIKAIVLIFWNVRAFSYAYPGHHCLTNHILIKEVWLSKQKVLQSQWDEKQKILWKWIFWYFILRCIASLVQTAHTVTAPATISPWCY